MAHETDHSESRSYNKTLLGLLKCNNVQSFKLYYDINDIFSCFNALGTSQCIYSLVGNSGIISFHNYDETPLISSNKNEFVIFTGNIPDIAERKKFLGENSNVFIIDVRANGRKTDDQLSLFMESSILLTASNEQDYAEYRKFGAVKMPSPTMLSSQTFRQREKLRQVGIVLNSFDRIAPQPAHPDLFLNFLKTLRVLEGRFPCTILCHDAVTARLAASALESPVEFHQDPESILSAYDRMDMIIANDVRASGVAASMGIPSLTLSPTKDSSAASLGSIALEWGDDSAAVSQAASDVAASLSQQSQRILSLRSECAEKLSAILRESISFSRFKSEIKVQKREVLSTTYFFRNRNQHQAVLNSAKGNNILVVGCSRGAEVYSLAIESEFNNDKLNLTAIDIDPKNIQSSERGFYYSADGSREFAVMRGGQIIKKFRQSVFPDETKSFFQFSTDGNFFLKKELISSNIEFIRRNLFDQTGTFDAIICNNVLVHLHDDMVFSALNHFSSLLDIGGVLAVGNTGFKPLYRFMQESGKFRPIEKNIDNIMKEFEIIDINKYTSPAERAVRQCTVFEKVIP